MKLEDVQFALTRLSQQDLARFREWYHEFEVEILEEHLPHEFRGRKFQKLAKQAIQDFQNDRCAERMTHFVSPDFLAYYEQLPADIRKLADTCFETLSKPHVLPSEHDLQKTGRFWFFMLNDEYWAFAVENELRLIWFWIGSYKE